MTTIIVQGWEPSTDQQLNILQTELSINQA